MNTSRIRLVIVSQKNTSPVQNNEIVEILFLDLGYLFLLERPT